MPACRWLNLSLCVLLIVTATACKKGESADSDEEASSDPTPSPSPTEIVGVVEDDEGFNIQISESMPYDYRFTQAGDTSLPCATATADYSTDITCLLDVNEFDLYFHGVKFIYNVPSTMCEYFAVSPYYFFYREPGTGPTTVSYDIDEDGSLANTSPSTVDFSTGTPICQYDYTGDEGPNCCEGSYALSVRTWDTDTDAYGAADVSTADWGGNDANCLAGPAMDTQSLTTDGWPTRSTFYVDGMGINDFYTVNSPIGKSAATNLYAANYFSAADHGDDEPLALRSTQPYYQFTCYDEDAEVKARIRVLVREWNEREQYDAVGDPDTTGDETIAGETLNDFQDWKDVGNSYPEGY